MVMGTYGGGRVGRVVKEPVKKLVQKVASKGKELWTKGKEIVTKVLSKKKTVKSAFEIAKDGGKHSGFYKQYVKKPTKDIQNGIKSINKEIEKHKDKIANPEKYIPEWDRLDPREQKALINKKWPGDIKRQKEQKQILQGILKER
jgi:gas vesicle protein